MSGPPPLTLAALERAVRAAWTRETSDDPHEWTPEWASRGQCGVTALLVRDLLGGEILIADVLRDGVAVERHAWNRLPGGLEIDLTRDQFRGGESVGPPAVGELLALHHERYRLLRDAVRARLALSGP